MGLFDFFKRKKVNKENIKEGFNKEEILKQIWDRWIKNQTQSPLTELLTVVSNLGACGHADFFDFCNENENIANALEVAFPLLPEVIKNNFLKASEYYKSNPEMRDDEEFLERYDNVFYDNEGLIDEVILSLYFKD